MIMSAGINNIYMKVSAIVLFTCSATNHTYMSIIHSDIDEIKHIK